MDQIQNFQKIIFFLKLNLVVLWFIACVSNNGGNYRKHLFGQLSHVIYKSNSLCSFFCFCSSFLQKKSFRNTKPNTPKFAVVLCLDMCLDDYEGERLSILGRLKCLEEKLTTLNDEEDEEEEVKTFEINGSMETYIFTESRKIGSCENSGCLKVPTTTF